jgi:hypothetical protein
MDLSDGDIKLLGAIRKRSRVARIVIVVFAVKSLFSAALAVWFGVEACRGSWGVPEEDPLWPVTLLVHQGNAASASIFGLAAVLQGVISMFAWSQKNSDRLILKLVDQASGYTTPR